jgi:signal transduction histidine kinase
MSGAGRARSAIVAMVPRASTPPDPPLPSAREVAPWFGPDDAAALADFFAVYEAHIDVRVALAEAATIDPVIATVLRDMSPSFTPELATEKRALLRHAIAGDWGPYERDLAREGATFAARGVRHWQAITRVVARELTPRLVEAYVADPPRLTAALAAMHTFLDGVRTTVGEAFQAQREAMLREVDALRAANVELEAFSAAAAHDLRAPLRAIGGFARAIEEDHGHALGATATDHLARIVANVGRMDRLIDALLTLARATRAPLLPRPVDLSALARDVAAELGAADPARAVEVAIEPGLVAVLDPPLARVLVENLLGNAWKFTSKVGSAHVTVGRDGAAFFVRDDGVGFDAGAASGLFSAFERFHRASDYPGTGLGLATSQRIVLRHRGRIWAASRPGEGATFWFEVPEG